MRVVSKARLRDFWEIPGHQDSEAALLNWYDVVKSFAADWQNFAELKAMFGSAGIFQDCVIFNIGGNKYRLITRVRYRVHKVFIVQALTHRDYDKGWWKAECRCDA